LQYDHYPSFFAQSYELEEGEVIPEYLKRMTASIVQRCGLPKDVDTTDMVRRGLISTEALKSSEPVPRWNDQTAAADTVAV
jgi:hypothetical protein